MLEFSKTASGPLRIGAIAATLLIAFAPGVAAKGKRTVTLLEKRVVLPIPPGFCPLSRKHRADRQALSLVERVNAQRNTVLLMFADCEELAKYRRRGTNLAHYGSYLAPVSATRPVKVPRATFTKIIGDQFEKKKELVKKAQEDAKKRVKATGVDASLQRNVNLGLVYRDKNGAYTGLIQNWQYEGSKRYRVTVISALTLINGRVVTLNLTAPHKGKRTVRALLRMQRRNVRRLIRAN